MVAASCPRRVRLLVGAERRGAIDCVVQAHPCGAPNRPGPVGALVFRNILSNPHNQRASSALPPVYDPSRRCIGNMGDTTRGDGIPYRTLGRTGERVSAIGLGGWHLGLKHVDEPLSFRIIRHAIDRGVNFLDNCWDYNEGASEIRMGNALRDGYRDRVFLMTKIDGRTRKEATTSR
jgi:hypothetical protein